MKDMLLVKLLLIINSNLITHQKKKKKRMPYIKEGFSIVYIEGNYYLALNHEIKFWHYKVDDKGLYKLYNKSIGEQCSEE